ncbi:MAG: DNA cytosine methyltransferase [Candidatus Omnitrophica bacterium]|nr:DNA cytosine methyltransferase [Candidatus Omnitrophota bacterium]MBU1047053.1 DNA cytosine methyltransferase [Candidatus Omnitrophota bacterium]MBU1630974.1 DNA cytosine methyltransferase [Candidatus Omnitrophota bacterium]MBU1767042.1 DNA cytosine methyltransferase [Candidatus Omnitrophota bacterium]MBU1889277.1 DNA cytosine methyltransferase [Candidatus Omnitrophota bacterium]
MLRKFKFIDLFCGVGGFHLALSSLGGECVFACDIDDSCRAVYKDNFGMEPYGDITKINERDIPGHDVLCAGFPCQSFSKAGDRLGLDDTRGTLFLDIVRIIKECRPSYLILENVRNLIGHDKGNTWRVISDNLNHLGYSFQNPPIIFSPHLLGIPQFRERVIILAQRKDLPPNSGIYFKGLSRSVSCNIEDILHKKGENVNLAPYALSKDEIKLIDTWNEFAQGIKGPLPGFPIWADEFKGEYDYSDLPKWKQEFLRKNREFYIRNKNFIDRWLKKHHNLQNIKPSRRSFEWQAQDSERDLWKLIIQIRPSGIRVKRPTYFPGLVAITQTSIVGKLRRRLTPREVARLQSFPDDFRFNVNEKTIYKQMGNSINVEVIKFFASRLLKIECQAKERVEVNNEIQISLPI